MSNLIVYVLILFAHVGPLGDGNSNALTTQEFNGKAACETAGNAAKNLARGTVKEISFACVPKG